MTSWMPEDGPSTWRWSKVVPWLALAFYLSYLAAGITTLLWGWPW